MGTTYDFSVLRDLRRREDLTIASVSSRSGVSSAVISKLERNRSQAELDTLYRLARVFGMTAADLLGLAEQRSAQRQTESRHASDGFDFREIAYGNVKALYGTGTAGANVSRPEMHKDDHEVCWVLSGSLRLCLPDERHDLSPGDAVQFDAILGHTYEALSDCSFVILHLTKAMRF